MRGSIFLRILFAIVLIAVLVGAGISIYNAGLAQGMAASGKLVAPAAPGVGAAPYPYYPYPFFFRPWGFGFFPFGFIFPLLFFLLIIFAIRGLFWRGGRGWRHHYGPYGEDQRGVPPMFEEWHRRMHESPTGEAGRPGETPNP